VNTINVRAAFEDADGFFGAPGPLRLEASVDDSEVDGSIRIRGMSSTTKITQFL
jgi:hypothetical protein